MRIRLDQEELELLEAYENKGFQRVRDLEKEKNLLIGAAKATLSKGQRINIR